MVKIFFYVQIISIYMNLEGSVGDKHRPPCILVYYSIKRKKFKSMTYTKIKFYTIVINFFFLGWIIKTLIKGVPLILKKWGARRRCNWTKMSRSCSLWYPNTVWTIALLFRKEGTRCQKYLHFFYPLFPNITFLYFKWLLLLEFLS